MNINEAIAEHKETARVCREVSESCAKEAHDYAGRGLREEAAEEMAEARVHAELAKEYEQIAEWLTELLAYRSATPDVAEKRYKGGGSP